MAANGTTKELLGRRRHSGQAGRLWRAEVGAGSSGRSVDSEHQRRRGVATVREWPRRAGAALIRGYQRYVSPAFPPRCRFSPSCSQYALEAVERYGLIRGSWMGALRLAKCHPFHPGGFDPVP